MWAHIIYYVFNVTWAYNHKTRMRDWTSECERAAKQHKAMRKLMESRPTKVPKNQMIIFIRCYLVRRSATSSLALFRCSILPIQIMPIYIFIMILSCERQFTCSLSQNQCHSTETIIKNSNIISAFIIGPGYLIYLFSSWNFKNFSSESQTIGMAKVRQCATGRFSIIWPTSPIG